MTFWALNAINASCPLICTLAGMARDLHAPLSLVRKASPMSAYWSSRGAVRSVEYKTVSLKAQCHSMVCLETIAFKVCPGIIALRRHPRAVSTGFSIGAWGSIRHQCDDLWMYDNDVSACILLLTLAYGE